ncbi:hypothetical protein EII20_07635 [Comamonadaceae bacterium OH2545_COT-014]|nr:hypothetical protein EII20_07635 [Comamonadaceae bacterium OH2545_COT-014]
MPTLLRTLTCAAAAALVAALAGCAAPAAQTPEQIVAERAEARWQHLIKGDFTGAYGYLMPSYRAIVPEKSYRQSFGSAGAWRNAIIHQVNCEPAACTVRVRITTQVRIPQFAKHIPEVNTYIDERWVREDGQWWLYQKL